MSDNVEVPNKAVIEMHEIAGGASQRPGADPVGGSLDAAEVQQLFHLANARRRSSSDLGRGDETQLVAEPDEIEATAGAADAPQTGHDHGGPARKKTTHPHLFDLTHSRKSSHHKMNSEKTQMHVHGFDHPLSWRHLFKPPVVRQWLAGGVLARETAEREAARFELFFDLAFVGVIHQLAEGANESESSWAIFKFIVFFFLGYSVWTDTRSFINTSGTDDVPQRAYVLLVMTLLLGYSSNASAIKIECPVAAEVTEGVVQTAVRLFRRAAEAAEEGGAETAESLLTVLPGGCELSEGWRTNVRGAVAFFLCGKLLRIVQCLIYGYWLPRFRDAHTLRALSIALGSAFYIPLLSVSRPIDFLVLPVVAIALELFSSYMVALILRFFEAAHRRFTMFSASNQNLPWSRWSRIKAEKDKVEGPGTFTPALNLEHIIERNALFVTLVLGEMVINITFQAIGSNAGIHEEFLRCVLGLFIAYFLNWIYADNDASRTFLHAIRRHWFTSITWSHLHFPLTASLVLASAALPALITADNPTRRIRFYFGGGLGTTMVTLALLGFMHKSLDANGSALLPHHYRLIARLVVGVIFATLPLADLSSTGMLGIFAGMLFALVLAETIGKLGSRGSEEKIKLALSSRKEGEPDRHRGGHHPEHDIHLEAAMHEEHEHGLTEHELGEDDVGNEGALGNIRVTKIGRRQRLAYVF